MKPKFRAVIWTATVALFIFLTVPFQVGAAEVTVVGVVTDNYQVVTDEGTVYDVADTDTGNEMLNHVSRKVEVVGEISGDEEVKVLSVSSFVVLEDQ